MLRISALFGILLVSNWSLVTRGYTWENCHGTGWVNVDSTPMKCYFIETTSKTFLEASNACWKNGQKLATNLDQGEYLALFDLLDQNKAYGSYWFGAIDGFSEGTFRWLDDSSIITEINNFEGNSEDLDCGLVENGDDIDGFRAAVCGEKFDYICERDLPTWVTVPSKINTTYGSNVTLECSFTTNYKFAPKWISVKDKARIITSGSDVLGGDRYQLLGNFDEGKYDLTIYLVEKDDAGTWICSLPDAEEPEKTAQITVPDSECGTKGYEIDQFGNCNDINECENSDTCHEKADCENTDGSFTCTCKTHYTGDGQECTDINECLDPMFKDCSVIDHEQCQNKEEGYDCICEDKYVKNEEQVCEIDAAQLKPESKCNNTLAPPSIPRCQDPGDPDNIWPTTPANCSITLLCPDSFSGLQQRTCDIRGAWEIVDETKCISAGIVAAKEKLNNVTDVETLVELLNIVLNATKGESSSTGDLLAAADFVSVLLAVDKTNLDEEKLNLFADESFKIISEISGVENADQVELLIEQVGIEGSVDKMAEMVQNAGKTIMSDMISIGVSSMKIETTTLNLGIYNHLSKEQFTESFIYPTPSTSRKKRAVGINETSDEVIESWVEFPPSLLNAFLAEVPEGETLGISITLLYSAAEIFPADFVSEALEYTVDWVDSITSVQSEPEVNTPLILISIQPEIILDSWPDPIILHLKHDQDADVDSNPQCAFIDYAGTNGLWNTDYCKSSNTDYDSGFTTCECKIVADIAAIMKIYNPVVHFLIQGLTITVTIASGFSVLLLLITFIFYLLAGLKLDRHFVLKNLLLAYIIMIMLALIGNNINSDSSQFMMNLCKYVSMFQHLIIVCCFSWSMIQCFQIKFRIANMVFNSDKYRKAYFIIGWIVPIIFVGIMEASMHPYFYFNKRCYVVNDLVIQTIIFMPIIVCIVVGSGMLIYAYYIYQLEKEKMDRVRHDLLTVWHELRSTMFIFPLFASSWLFGYLYAANNNDTIIYGYCFALLEIVLSSSIYLCFCQINEEILLAVGRHCCSSAEFRNAVAETERLEEERLNKIKHIKTELELYKEKLKEERKQRKNRSSLIENIFMAARETQQSKVFKF